MRTIGCNENSVSWGLNLSKQTLFIISTPEKIGYLVLILAFHLRHDSNTVKYVIPGERSTVAKATKDAICN